MHYIIVWDTYQRDFLLSFQTFTFADSRSRKALFFGEILNDEDYFSHDFWSRARIQILNLILCVSHLRQLIETLWLSGAYTCQICTHYNPNRLKYTTFCPHFFVSFDGHISDILADVLSLTTNTLVIDNQISMPIYTLKRPKYTT